MRDIKDLSQVSLPELSSQGPFADIAVTSSSPTSNGTIISVTIIILFSLSSQSCTSSSQDSEHQTKAIHTCSNCKRRGEERSSYTSIPGGRVLHTLSSRYKANYTIIETDTGCLDSQEMINVHYVFKIIFARLHQKDSKIIFKSFF